MRISAARPAIVFQGRGAFARFKLSEGCTASKSVFSIARQIHHEFGKPLQKALRLRQGIQDFDIVFGEPEKLRVVGGCADLVGKRSDTLMRSLFNVLVPPIDVHFQLIVANAHPFCRHG